MSDEQTLAHRQWHEQNRRSWNEVTPIHNRHKADQAEFFARGGSTLFSEEIELLGELDQKDVVHLQCNCGQDTLSLAALGARVTGVDIADRAIAFGRELADQTGIRADFVRSDLFDWFDSETATFDVAFSSYGTIGWLADLDRWARGVESVLRPGGHLVLLEFHPLVWSLSADGLGGDSYFEHGVLKEDGGVNDYVGQELAPSGFIDGGSDFRNPEVAFSFQWTLAQTVQAVVDAGLRISTLREYPYANGCELYPGMRRLAGRRFATPENHPDLPLMFGLVAQKPST